MNISSLVKKKMFKETLTYSIGSFGSKILSFLLVPFYTYFLTKKELGEYDLLLTTISLFAPLVSLQISDATYRWLIDKEYISETEKAKIMTNSIITLCIGYLIFCLGFSVYIFFNSFQYQGYFIVLIFLNCLLPLLQSILRGQGDTRQFAINGILTTFLIVVFNVIFIYLLKLNVEGVFIANILAYTVACILILYKVRIIQYFKFKYWDPKLIKSMASYSLPLIPNLMSWWAISSASKFIILHYMGPEGNGLYAVASRFPALLLVINSVLLLPLQDRILKEQDDVTFNRLLGKFIVFEMALAFILGILSPLMTKILVSKEYFDTWQYMPYLYLGVGFNAIAGFLGLKYQKEKNTLKITLTTLLGAVVSIVLSIILIQYIGLQGISISFLLGFLVVLLVRYIDIYKKDVFNFKFFIIIALPMVSYLSILLIKKAILCF
ncbi:MATE efflux family protein [Chryseobacterium gleum]|uniref:MATE efflux family protein n=2 Tax=Chryseobacterium gleum TaxID=250 RepID=A0A3S4N7R0_CHRGE|nr:polysaccharide biosynthesis C-terminal domain-containing protein [Chryseobacterium gleum]EFK35853.1 polysaccharide biosynthesis protein [Chryseobacterium gleum ATCC 35910]QQY31575.1 polysaccharide biosynthesis C-terminal domain-containing protein [Chryseobacterium gleum]VEE11616.1 MATE efflux family protein [Chryseobacterium gleum]